MTAASEQLKKFFGFKGFKGNQEPAIQSLLDGHDTFVIMPTGGGKSLCYQLPALMMEGTAIVVSPLIALMKNQVDSIRSFSSEVGIAHVLNSSLTKKNVQQVQADLRSGITKLLYVAPESLTKDENIELLQQIKISFYAIDEAHCISEWGHDFRPEYRNLRSIINRIVRRPVIALTATATPKVQSDIQKNLGMESANVFVSSFNRDNLFYEVRPKKDIENEIIKFIRNHAGKSGIIYCLSRKKVEEIAETLQVNGINAVPYHAGLDSATRVKHQDAFLMEDVEVVVATIAFGMGIDKPDVRFVIHHDIPKSLESYYQETGRAGRDGGEGICLAFYSHKDIEKLEKFMNNKPVSEQEIGKQLIQETVGFVETSCCRRVFLLHYFGEKFSTEDCNEMCDNCKNPRSLFDASKDLRLVLEAVKDTNQRLKIQHITSILRGELNSIIKSNRAHTLPIYGKGTHGSELHWTSVMRQAIVQGYLVKDIETYGVLKMNEKSEAFLQKPVPFMIREDHNFDLDFSDSSEGAGGTAVLDDVLFKQLKDLRKKEAQKIGVPPYVVFQEISLSEMATHYPTSMEELKQISGVGEGKAKKYGTPFVNLISKHVEENDIEKDSSLSVKSVVNKSKNKVYIIQSMDRKLSLEDIASSKGMTMTDLITEIEHIVHSGTKVNLNYHIEDILDEEEVEEIYDYFMEADSDDIAAAIEEFNGDYEEEILRLIRIKFLSDVAN